MADDNTVERIGFVGAGMMGAPMSRALARAGLGVMVYDVNEAHARAAVLDDDGAPICAVASSLDAIASSSVVILMLPTSDVVEHVLLEEGLAAQLTPGTVVVDMSSSEPNRTVKLGAWLADLGVAMIDAPVSGGVARARQGTLTIMAGGSSADLDRCRPMFAAMAAQVFHVGALGCGHAIKSLNNLLSACGLLISIEATEVARGFGVDAETFLAVVNQSTGRNDATENKVARFVLSERYDSGFTAALMAKDLRIAEGLAHSTGAPAQLLGHVCELWQRAASLMPAGSDQTEIVRYLAAGPSTPSAQ
jgi:3-hydroxyisobutyrate dehydrogenase